MVVLGGDERGAGEAEGSPGGVGAAGGGPAPAAGSRRPRVLTSSIRRGRDPQPLSSPQRRCIKYRRADRKHPSASGREPVRYGGVAGSNPAPATQETRWKRRGFFLP